MDNSKYVDLHKIAAIFRGIQEEEYAKNNEEVAELDNAMEDAVEEDNAFNTAAAKAALAGEKEFSFNGKKYPVKMSKEDAKKLMDDAVNSEEAVEEGRMSDLADIDQAWPKISQLKMKLADQGMEPEEAQDAAAEKLGYDPEMVDQYLKYKFGEGTQEAVEDKDAEEVLKKGMEDELADTIKDKIEDDEESTDEAEVSEEPQGEQVAVMSTDTLAQILNLAGVKPVTDADINQPEGEAEQVEEYSNSPEEEYADTDFMTNKLAGGANRPKKFPNVGNQGHNDLVQRLTKAYNEQKD